MYGSYDIEPYYEPTVADIIFIEAKQKLEEALKDSVKYKLEGVINENEELKVKNKELQKQVSEIKSRERQLEFDRQDLERKVRRERFSQLMKDYQTILYTVKTQYLKTKKCNNCDDNRKIHFKSPSGKDMTEYCECDKSIPKKIVKENKLVEFRLNRDRDEILAWYELKIEPKDRDSDYDHCRSTNRAEVIYNSDMKFEDLNRHEIFFREKEDCQKYCDFLNKDLEEVDMTPESPKKRSKK